MAQKGNSLQTEELRESWVMLLSVFVKVTESEVGVGLELPAVISSNGWLCNRDAAVCRSAGRGGDGGGDEAVRVCPFSHLSSCRGRAAYIITSRPHF